MRGGVKQGAHGLPTLEELLEVVHDNQHVSATEVVDHCLEDRPTRLLPELERLGDGGRHEARIGDRAQIDEVHAVRLAVELPSRDLQREACLPCSSRSGQREESCLAEKLPELGNLTLTPNERCSLGRKVRLPGIECSDGREDVKQAVHHQLIQMLRPLDVLQVVYTEVSELHAIRQSVLDQGSGRVADDHLPAVRSVRDPGGTVDVESDVPVRPDHAFAHVKTHAHGHVMPRWPGLARDISLRRNGGLDSAAGGSEHGEHRITLGADLDALVVGDCLAEDLSLPPEDVRVVPPQCLKQPGRALHVGEEEGHGPGRKALAHRVILRRRTRSFHPLRPSPSRRAARRSGGC